MNKAFIALLAFLCGGGVGYLVAVKLLEDKYAQQAQEEIDSVKEHYSAKIMHDHTSKEEPVDNGMTEEEHEAGTRSNKMPLVRNSINEGGAPVKTARTSYNEMAKEQKKSELGFGSSSVTDADEEPEETDSDEDEQYVDAAGMYEGDHIDRGTTRDLSNVDREEPYVISAREYTDEFPHHDKVSLYYYVADDTLMDEDEDVIDDIDETVGWDVFHILEMQSSAWVRNERLGIDYEICSVRNGFAGTRGGAGVRENLSPREKHLRDMKRKGLLDE